MKGKRMLTTVLLAFGLIACLVKFVGAAPMGTAFTYQGFLMDDRLKPVNGLHDFWFSIYDDRYATGEPNRVAGPNTVSDVNVVDGYFRAELDFGSEVFTGDARWLETAVRRAGTTDPCDVLRPRLRVTLSPYAIYTDMAGAVLDGIVGAGTVDRLAKFIDTGTIGDSIIYEQSGRIGIGEPSPSETLHVAGKVRIVDGSEGPEKVLTSDADGVATWQSTPALPRGVIVMWSGSIAAIPAGWALCDGGTYTAPNGDPVQTPNLTSRFIRSIPNASTDPGSTGGSSTHTHGPGSYGTSDHTHGAGSYQVDLTRGYEPEGGNWSRYVEQGTYPISGTSSPGGGGTVTGTSSEASNLPPYYQLAFIMKL